MARRTPSISRSAPPSAGLRTSKAGSIPPASASVSTSIPPSLTARVIENGILAAAMKVFARRGFSATRVEDLLEEAGVARRTFYRYFGSKEDVLAAVYELATGELLRALDDAADAASTPLAGVLAGVELYVDFHAGNAALLRVLAVEAVRTDSALSAHRRRFRAELLRVMVRARGLPLDGFTYVALVSALEGVALELLDGGASPDEVRRAKRSIVALVEKSLT